MKLHLKVKPNSKADELLREADGTLKAKIKAPPFDGKANQYLVGFLSKILELPKSKIVLLKGQTNSYKTFEIEAKESYIISRLP
mgnify:CR=1 FL=1